MNPNFQNRRMPPNNRNRGGQNRFNDNRKPQGLMDTKMTKPEKMDIKDMNKKDQQEKPSPKPDQTNKREPPSPAHNQQNRQNQNQQNRQHQNQQNRQQHQNQQNMRDQMNKNNDSQNESMDQGENAPKKFTGRCRLFVGNLPNDTTEEQFRALFTPYGELSEVFVNPSRGFGFVRLDTRQNAEAAKAALDGVQKKNRVLRVRFATHGAALRIKFLPAHVSNELLEEAFSNFGPVERAVVIVDDRGKPTGDAIVEFARKPAAMQALGKINDGAFLLGASPRPVLAEPLEQKDEEDGYPEKFIMKNAQFHKEREQGPRFAPPGSFEFEMAQKWKEVYRMEADHKVQLQREMDQAIARLELEQEQAIHEHQAMLLRQDLMRRQEELRKLEERQMEMAKRMEMTRQEDDMRRQEEDRRRQEMMMRQQQEQEMRRRQMENRAGRGGPGGPGAPSEDFEMRGSGNRGMERGAGGRSSFNEMRGGRPMENRNRGEFNEGQGDMSGNMGPGAGEMGGSGAGMRRGNEGGGGGGGRAPPMQPPPAPPAALGLDRQRQGGMGGGGSEGGMGGGSQGGGMGGGNQGGMGGGGGGNMRQSRFDQSAGNQGGFGGNNMGPGGNMGGNGGMGNNSGGSMGGRGAMGGNSGGGMNRRREGGPREDYFENKRPRF